MNCAQASLIYSLEVRVTLWQWLGQQGSWRYLLSLVDCDGSKRGVSFVW